uniref:Tubulin-tyrosine ligase family protein n=1 Tax=viral metagenome TaxID=1070528 RepID=A0A6C0I2I3_9ZZZZ
MILILLILLILIIALIVINILQKYKSPILGGRKKHIANTRHIANTSHTYRLFLFKDKNEKNQNYDRHHFQYLIDALNALGWKETDKPYADFAFSLSFKILYDRHFKADLKYGFNGIDTLYHKNSLFCHMQEPLSNYLPYTENLEHFVWKNGNIIIVKEVFSYGQAGVYVIIDEQSFIKLKDRLLSENKKAICSTYITNPLLCKGKKFHLRILIAPFLQRKKTPIVTYMKTMITLKMAKSEYIIKSKEDYLDPDMNISGGATNDELLIWDIDQCKDLLKYSEAIIYEDFFKKCNKSIHDAIHSIPLDSLSLFHNQNAGYFIYGADIMLDDTGHAWILELNKRPQHIGKIISKYPKKFEISYTKKYFSELFQWLLDDIILPYFSKDLK